LINVEVHNRIEGWIAELELRTDAHQYSVHGTPREQLLRRLREQEDAVADSFAPTRKSSGDPRRTDAPAPALGSAPALKKSRSSPKPTAKPSSPKPPRIIVDRQFIKLVAALLVIAATGAYLAYQAGVIGREPALALDAAQLQRLSPLLARGWIKGSGAARRLDAMMLRKRWLPLSGRERELQAERLAKALSNRGVNYGAVDLEGAPAITIEGGAVSYVAGGKI
jgi:hypothetical protein